MIENRNESELEAHLRRVIKHSGNLSGLKSDRGNEKTGLRMVSSTYQICTQHTLKCRGVTILQIHSLLHTSVFVLSFVLLGVWGLLKHG